MVKGLARELVRLGHTVDVVTMGFRDLPEHEFVDGITVHRIDCGRRLVSKCTAREAFRYVMRARPRVRSLLEKNAYDLVHTHFIFPDGIIALSEAGAKGVPYIITAHGSDVPGYNQKPFFKLVHPMLVPVWRRVTHGARAIVSPSQTLAGLIESMQPGTEVLVIENGIDVDKYRPLQKTDQVLVATRLVERKGVQHVLRAFAGSDLGWQAIVVGSGEYQEPLKRLNEDLGRPARFVGWLNNESTEFRELLEKSAIYALPSDFENFPVGLLEAMAAGAAIVTTRGHGCEEVVGDTAELVTPGCEDADRCVAEIRAALERLTSDRAYCAQLGARARQRLDEKFGWRVVARRYLELYERQVS